MGEASCDKTTIIEGMYVNTKIKNPPLRWYLLLRKISGKVRGIYACVDAAEIVRLSAVKPQVTQTLVTKKLCKIICIP